MNGAIVEVKALRREYDDVVAVNDVSITVPKGTVFALVGPNGAGKTTFMKMVTGLLEPTSGTAVVGGFDIRTQPREAQSILGFLPDFFGLYDDIDVSEYLEFFARAYRIPAATRPERARSALARTGLLDKREAPVGALSRGMRQRLGIARALIHDPPLIILDEPAAGLDPEARYALSKLFRELAGEGKTLMVSSHILTELEDYCTHVAIMRDGGFVADGTVAEVRARLSTGRRILVRARAAKDALAAQLRDAAHVTEISLADGEARFHFGGDDDALAALLKRLVVAGVAVSAFSEEAGGIQDAYLSLMGKGR